MIRKILKTRHLVLKSGALLFGVAVSTLFFNNCSSGFSTVNLPSGQSSFASLDSEELPGSSPANTSPDLSKLNWISMKSVGTNDPACLSNSNFDACIFYKNPFVQSVSLTGAGLATGLSTGTDLSKIQTFGVALKDRTSSSRLESPSLIVTLGTTNASQQKPIESPMTIGTQAKVAYRNDTQSVTALTHSYFWLQQMEEQLKFRTNIYFAANKKIEVFMMKGDTSTLSADLINNAFWSSADSVTDAKTEWLSIGIANTNSKPGYYEEGLDAEVLLHEMGHANFAFAKGYPNYDIFADNYSYYACATASGNTCTAPVSLCGNATNASVDPNLGCQSAINEGLADFHYLMMFPDYPTIWETNYMSIEGLPSRNMRTAVSKKISEFIVGQFCDIMTSKSEAPALTACTNSQSMAGVKRDYAEIHRLGAAYAAILYAIYSNAKTDKRAFEKTFLLHLQQITPSTRFPETRDILLGIDENNFASVNSDIISAVFSAKGIN